MNPAPISLQLFSVRDLAKADLAGTLKKISDLGYIGVELAGMYGRPPAELRALLDDLGLVVCSTHAPLPTEENLEEVVETARILGYTFHVSGWGPAQFETLESTLEHAKLAQKAAALLKPYGLRFGIHNHWWEFDHQFDGKYPHEVLMEAAPDVFAELDTYWAKTGGADPAAQVAKLGARAPLLHIKDGPANKEEAMTAVGQGLLDWPAIIGAAGDEPAWLIVELDRCDTDMMQALADSYAYLVGNGLARGRK